MNIVSYVQGVSVRKFQMDEVQPAFGVRYAAVVAAMQQRYSFVNAGESVEAQQRGVHAPAYEAGEFELNGEKLPIIGLDFNVDGVRAIAHTTDVADAFLSDLFEFLKMEFNYKIERINILPLYASTLLVDASPEEIAKVFASMESPSRIWKKSSGPLERRGKRSRLASA